MRFPALSTKKARTGNANLPVRAFWYLDRCLRRAAKDPDNRLFFQYLFKLLDFTNLAPDEIDFDISRKFSVHQGLDHFT